MARRSHPEGEPCEREGSGRRIFPPPRSLWVAEAPRRMTAWSCCHEIRTIFRTAPRFGRFRRRL